MTQQEITRDKPDPAGSGQTHRLSPSLRTSILMLVLASLLPAFALAAYIARENYRMAQDRLNNQSLLLARSLSARLDRELAAIESGLKVLATSDDLAAGDLRKFHQQASEAVRSQIVYNYILTDEQGRQLVNTLRPFGSQLPVTGTPAELAAVFKERRTVLTDMFEGPVVRRPTIAMGVPVQVGDNIRYSLNIGLDPRALIKVLTQEEVPSQWLAVILDSSATIVTRTRNPEEFVGQKPVPEVFEQMMTSDEATLQTHTKEGIPVTSSHHRSKDWKWIVAVGVNKEILQAELNRNLQRLLIAATAAIVLAWGLATLASGRLVRNLRELNEAARSIAQGIPHTMPLGGFRETQDIADTLHLASEAMRDSQHRATHDPLTGLANRALFDEMALNQIARARREQGCFAVLAIDLDHFKLVNDTCGHAAGDAVLCQVARRLLANVRDFDVAARLGGDEFLVLLASADTRLAQDVARRIIDALSRPYEGTDVAVSASIGIALYPAHGSTHEGVLQKADQALYKAKRSGRGRCVPWEHGVGGENPQPSDRAD